MADETDAQIGAGTSIAYWNPLTSPPTYTVVAAVLSLDPPGKERPEVPSTTLDSTSVERISGLPDADQMTIVMTMNATSLPLAKGWVDAGVAIDFRISYPAPTSLSEYFTLVPLKYKPGQVQPSGLVDLTFMGRVTGEIEEDNPHA